MKKYLALLVPLLLLAPQLASATATCGFGTLDGSGECVGYLTSGTSWKVPSDWNNNANTIEAIGGGADGAGGSQDSNYDGIGGTGGGGGATYIAQSVALTLGASVGYSVGAAGGGTATGGGYSWTVDSGGDTYFCNSSSSCTEGHNSGIPYWGSGVVVAAQGGGQYGGPGNSSYGGEVGVGSISYPGSDGAGPGATTNDPNGTTDSPGGNGGNAGGYGIVSDAGAGGSGGVSGYVITSYEYPIDGTDGNSYGGGGGGGGGNAGCDPTGCDNGGAQQGNGGMGAPGIIVIAYVPLAPTCTITATPSSIDPGGSATVSWSSTNDDTFYINNMGYVPASGSVQVSPSATTDYAGTATGAGGTVACDATLTVNVPTQTCADGSVIPATSTCPTTPQTQTCPDGSVIAATSTCSTTPQTQTCPDGSVIAASASCPATQTCADGSVIPILQTCSGTTLTCPTGQVASGDQCLCVSTGAAPVNGSCAAPLSCPVGYTQQGSTCVFVQCPSGYTQQSDQCVQIVCPAGQQLDSGGNCTTIACAPYDYCGSDGNVWYGDPGNASCTSQPVLSDPCGVYGCSSGACVAPQPGSLLSWSVAPTIVHSGSPTTVTWSAKYVSLCAIGSTNGDSWTCTKGACLDHPAETSNAITGQTIFTITCTGLDGNPVPSKQTIVNILPTFQEQ